MTIGAAHVVTIRLLKALAEQLPDDRADLVLAQATRAEQLLGVQNDESARRIARDMLRDAFSV